MDNADLAPQRPHVRKSPKAESETRCCLWCRNVFDATDEQDWVCGSCRVRGHAPGQTRKAPVVRTVSVRRTKKQRSEKQDAGTEEKVITGERKEGN